MLKTIHLSFSASKQALVFFNCSLLFTTFRYPTTGLNGYSQNKKKKMWFILYVRLYSEGSKTKGHMKSDSYNLNDPYS